MEEVMAFFPPLWLVHKIYLSAFCVDCFLINFMTRNNLDTNLTTRL